MTGHGVAIVGMAVRVADAQTPDELWAHVLAGRVCLPAEGGDGTVLRMGQLDRLAQFDAELFGLTPLQARVADPQHRALLELSWLGLEDAGIDPTRAEDLIGVYVGCGPARYLLDHVASQPDLLVAAGVQQVALLNDRDFLASSLSFRLGLSGASITVQTACSTGLVAVHQAVRALLTYDVDVALAGAATIQIPPEDTYAYREGDVLSPDGRCRPFTRGSGGTVPASGAAIVVLKRLDDALAAGDRVRAVILGSSVNNDGARRMSESAPSPDGHKRVIQAALAVADVPADSVAFVQTHGTGTELGDQVELAALGVTYGRGEWFPAALGAVKANVGHADTAAGAIGLVTAVLALEHATIPPVPAQPGDGADLELSGRLVLPRAPRPFPPSDVNRAAVSSLGLGGTNAHVVLQAAPVPRPTAGRWTPPVAVALSAATDAALRERAARLVDGLPASGLADTAGTLWHRRRALPVRIAPVVTAPDEDGARAELIDALHHAVEAGAAGRRAGPVVALLPGQGDGVSDAGDGFARHHNGFRRHFDTLTNLIRSVGGPDLPAARAEVAAGARVVDTAVVQPWLFAVELALLRTFADAGVEFAALAGHSLGELTAATFAGVFAPADAARAVVERGRIMGTLPGGAMVAVDLDDADARTLADGLDVDIAALNDERVTVLACPTAAIDALVARGQGRGARVTRLAVSHAFHSRMMDPAIDRFAAVLATMRLSPPHTQVWSNRTGAPLTDADATSPRYWAGHLRDTVRFRACLAGLLDRSPAFVVVAGPGEALAATARRAARRRGFDVEVLSVPGPDRAQEPAAYLRVLARLWESGRPIDLAVPPPATIANLPPYPLAGTAYWAGPEAAAGGTDDSAVPVSNVDNVGPGLGEGDTAVTLAQLWQRAFGGPAIEAGDNFFELGGSSLQAAQLVNVVADTLVVDVGLNDLYEHSTFVDFARRVEALIEERDASPEFAALLAELGSREVR